MAETRTVAWHVSCVTLANMTSSRVSKWLSSACILGVASVAVVGCQPTTGDEPMTFEEAPVSPLGPLMDDFDPGAADEAKADQRLPMEYELLSTQSPVRNQAGRGVCTIFSTTALMESLYISEGSIPNPDFSEQFLQWSSKVEGRRFLTSGGSNNEANLAAITRFGTVTEASWPYQTSAWTAANDPGCGMPEAMRPVQCHTNGEPPAAALAAQRFYLPAARSIRSTPDSIRGYMVTNRQPVVVSGTFFYQAWNHGGSMLTVNRANGRLGLIQYPNAEDRADSMMRPAGHGVLIVGYDSDMSVQRTNAMGQPEVDAMGRPVMETGFYLIKNSWGDTGNFGSEQVPNTAVHPRGYGWISMRYVQEFMAAYVSGIPRITRSEVCNDMVDNDRDGRNDCMDTDCASNAACMMPPVMGTTTATPNVAIPDNNTTGVVSEINITEPGQIASLAVDVGITHTYRGDLKLTLEHNGRTVTLVDRQGGGTDNIREAFSIADFNGTEAMGVWRLRVVDTSRTDTGTFDTWGLRITRCMGASCMSSGMETTRTFENTMMRSIPDNNATGVSSDIAVTQTGTITRMAVTVRATHAFPADLRIALRRVGGAEVVLFDRQDTTDTNFVRTFNVPNFADQAAAGTWRLVVSDRAASDTGSLTGWSMDLTTR